MTKEMIEGMLASYRVLDLTNERGFICGKLLGDLGADVIKIEKPGGDASRSIGPFYHDLPDPEKSLHWFAFNTSKRGLTLDIETVDGREIFKRLVKSADILIESFDPGYLERLGLGYSALSRINPRIILTSISGFGQTGPYKDYKAPDIAVWALSGNAYLTGDPDRRPLIPSFPVVYFAAGALQAAVGTMVALFHREVIGKGQHVDASAQLSLAWATGPEAQGLWQYNETIVRRQGRLFQRPRSGADKKTEWLNVPLLYQCKDGDINFIPMAGPGLGEGTAALVKWMDSEGMAGETLKEINWLKFNWRKVSQEVMDEIAEDFKRFFLTHTKAEILEEAGKMGTILYPLFTPKDMLDFEQLAAREYWIEVEHPELGTTITYPGSFVKTAEAPYRIYSRAPLIGEHNEEIYTKELGLSKEEVLTLKQRNVI